MSSSKKLTFSIDKTVVDSWTKLTTTESISWVACGYSEKDSSLLEVKAEGSGGMPEFQSFLADDIIWGAFKVVGIDDRGNLVARRPKYVFVKYMPAAAATMKKARAGGHKGAIKQVLAGHVDLEIESPADLTEDAVILKLRSAGGAHQPTSYEFSDYSAPTVTSASAAT